MKDAPCTGGCLSGRPARSWTNRSYLFVFVGEKNVTWTSLIFALHGDDFSVGSPNRHGHCSSSQFHQTFWKSNQSDISEISILTFTLSTQHGDISFQFCFLWSFVYRFHTLDNCASWPDSSMFSIIKSTLYIGSNASKSTSQPPWYSKA